MTELEGLKLLRALDEGVAAKTGAAFFPHLVSALAQTLHASCAFASEFDHEKYEARTLAFWCDGSFSAPYTYSLAGSPCECVLDNEIVAFPRSIQEMFPAEKEELAQIGAQSYLAIPLCGETGTVCGHLAVIDRHERDWNEADFEILRIFSSRAGAELERRDYEKRLEGTNVALQRANAQLRREVTQRLEAQDQLATTTARSEQVAELVRVITSGVTSQTGTAFFQELVRLLAEALKAHTVFVSEIDTVKYEADMLAFWTNGALQTPQRFNLAATPCESILDGEIAAFPRRVAELFPAAKEVLDQLGTKSYLAIPIVDGAAGVIGHIAVQDQRERDWNDTDFGILRLFATRAAAELKRRTHEKSLEYANTQLQKANAALRREVATRLEMEGQLARAKQMAEEAQRSAEAANQAKSSFLAHMSHELRTPLNGILGYAQLLKRHDRLDTEQLENVSVIERSGEHLLTLINDLLDLAKIEAGRLDLHASLFDPRQLLKHVADIAAVRAAQAGLAFTIETAGQLPAQVRGDERAIRQILLNLLGNAVKFTAQGSVHWRVSVTNGENDRCRIRFEVTDTGIGIPEKEIARIFEPFQRGDGAGRHREGTGLGLAITRRLVEAMDGKLEVQSRVGEGSTFTVDLDLETASEGQGAFQVAPQIIGYEGRRRRLVVADDDCDTRRLIVRMLGGLGFDIGEAAGASEALAMARAELPDLVITDLSMPGVTGLELARRIRDDEMLRAVPLLAISASASDFTRDEALAAGCDGFVAKPLRAEELLESIRGLLGLTWRTAEQVAPGPEAHARERLESLEADGQFTSELYDLAMKGDVKELLSRAKAAVEKDPAGGPLYDEVRRLARQFDMKGVRRALQRANEAKR